MYISNDLNFDFKVSPRRGIIAVVPPLSNYNSRAQSLYDNSFSVIAPKLWNILPAELTMISTFSHFKAALDEFLSTKVDKPPIQGYPYVNNNSLVFL